MSTLSVFIVHGRDNESVINLKNWIKDNHPDIEAQSFEDISTLGEPIPKQFEQMATLADAAIVMATPDDFGRLKDDYKESPRARQNVWIELGWFWARLGITRTLLLIKGELDVPTDLGGLLYSHFSCCISEASADLDKFIRNLRSSDPDSVTELVGVAADSETRTKHYKDVVESATSKLIITGVGMQNVKQEIQRLFAENMIDLVDLRIEFLIPDREIIKKHEQLFTDAYREDILQDLIQFEKRLNSAYKKCEDSVRQRIALYKYPGIVTISATVSDPGSWGSLMTVESILLKGKQHDVSRPRLIIKRRCEKGMYQRYLKGLETMKENSKKTTLPQEEPIE